MKTLRRNGFRVWTTSVWSASLLLLAAATASAAPEIPGAAQQKPIALTGATIHPVTGPAISDGVLVFDQGKIVAVGKNVAVPPGAQRIDVQGKHVYPALFDAYTDMGLVEISAVRATRDQRETGQINPNVKSWVAVNPDSEIIPVTRSNGVLLALTAPSGGLIAGQSAVLQLDGWSYEDMTLAPHVGMHVRWPRMSSAERSRGRRSGGDQDEARDQALAELQQAFDDARAYRRARQADGSDQAFDARWQAMFGLLDGDVPLIVEADQSDQIQAAVAFAQRQQLKLIIYGGYDAADCAELLKQHHVPVIVGGVYRLPERRWEAYDTPFTIARRLHEAKVKYCISGRGRSGASNVRNLPYHAATAAAFGLPKDEALKAITIYPAEILGVAQRVGSLEPGKDATLIVTDGDPLETPTQVLSAYIQGRQVDLNNRHKRLWKKYEEKYKRQAQGK